MQYFPAGIFYVQVSAGVSFALNKTELDYSRTVAFDYSPEIGVRVPLGERNMLDIGAVYERTTKFKEDAKNSKVNFYGLKIGYPFPL